ncbi:rCG37099 [Rattus norvegicus]|uniref:RCG37099 n=1 Tax=Rattus norvegicus TaxID=10116 RepID=A6HTV9_RAT|nr:rCG37099 [Rattus norvegicus]
MDVLLIFVLLRYLEVEPTKPPGDSAGKSGIWQRGMKDLFLASAISSFEMICQVRMIQGLVTIHSELLGSE